MKTLFEELVDTRSRAIACCRTSSFRSNRNMKSAYGASAADIVTIELLYCFAFNIKFPVCDD